MPAKLKRHIIGLMSGTSADGISACLAEITGNSVNTKVKLVASQTYPYKRELRETILQLTNSPKVPIEDVARLNIVLGKELAGAATKIAGRGGIALKDIDLIGSHGHTVIHKPPLPSKSPTRATDNLPFTLQIGEPSFIALETGVTTIADFRMGDLAAGGNGAPLVPYTDYLLFRHPAKSRAIQNIGGIANVTFLPQGCTTDDIIAFDNGPGNMVIDRLTKIITRGRQDYDDSGKLAEKGSVNEDLLARLMNHPYLLKPLPKSTGREDFGTQFTDTLYKEALANSCDEHSILATATAFTAKSIAESYKRYIMPRHKVSEIILCGGGSKNNTLVKFLRKFLGEEIPLHTVEDFGIPTQAKEALSFAILANETICGNPANIPAATGARERVVLGKVIPGRNWRSICPI